MPPRRLPGRLVLLGLLVVFFAPIVVAWWLNAHPDRTTSELVNHGTLIPGTPILSEEGLTSIVGEAPPGGYFTGRWTLLYVNSDPACGARCTNALYTSRQVRWALGRRMDRVQRVLVQGPDPSGAVHARLAAIVDGEEAVYIASATPVWHARLAATPGLPGSLGPVVLVVDPSARLVLFHSLDDAPEGLIQDMTRLLRYSKLG